MFTVVIGSNKNKQLTRGDVEIMIQENFTVKYAKETCQKIESEESKRKMFLNGVKDKQKKIDRKLLDLEIGKQKAKFKKGDKVEWELDTLDKHLGKDTSGMLIFISSIKGEYVCRELDYEEGCWMVKVLVDCEIKKIKESELKKVKNDR